MRVNTKIEVSSLPRLAEWAKVDPHFTPLTWLFANANMEMAVAFTALFWPELEEHDGGIFLKEFFNPDVYADWKVELKGDLPAIERVMNHRHVDTLLPDSDSISFANLQHLGQVLAATWKARLANAYPERQFSVTCSEDTENEEVIITFCQSPEMGP